MYKELFLNAFTLWLNKPSEERPRHGSQVYDFFMDRFRPCIVDLTKRLGFDSLIVEASVGRGAWAEIPWIGIRDPKAAKSFGDGVFIAYLFASENTEFFLALIQGVSSMGYTGIEANAQKLRTIVKQPIDFTAGIKGELSKKPKLYSTPDKYKKAIVYSKKYTSAEMPEDSVLEHDLNVLLKSYEAYANSR